MECKHCALFNGSRCRSGKVNPSRKEDAILIAQLMGIRALCFLNPFREPLIRQWFEPSLPPLPIAQGEVRHRGCRAVAWQSEAGIREGFCDHLLKSRYQIPP